ncbi:pentapeptide repeat-containing protein [Nocardiopsis sp. NPDC055551]|uniref:pentapeptide repeat-containing protein n=1 Tax=Nocardiopsis sp. NPDC006832 TaxID=3157188 RepID=UPI00340D9414
MRSPTPRQWVGIALAAVALPALAATSWPLFTFLLGLFPPGLPLRSILLGTGLVAALGIAAVLIRPQQSASVRLWWLILAAWAVAIGAVAAMVLLVWLILGTPGLDVPAVLPPRALDAIATRSFAIVAGLGGVALLAIHYRRQRTTEADAERAEQAAAREVAKLFTDTFDSASDKLGSDHAAVRLAGVHALARLADEAPEGREDLVQMVIDVLCAYLRMPYTSAPRAPAKNASTARREEHRERELEFAASREVRHTILRIIGQRLRGPTRWRGKDYDFTGVVFDGCDLRRAHFTGGFVDFTEAEFTGGDALFTDVHFTGGEVLFWKTRFTGGKVFFLDSVFKGTMVSFFESEFTGSQVLFSETEIADGGLDFPEARFVGGHVDFSQARVTGGRVDFTKAEIAGGQVDFTKAEFAGGRVDFTKARFTDGHVVFSQARLTGGNVDFTDIEFAGGEVDFAGAEFASGEVDFAGAELAGGRVDFAEVRFTGGEVNFFQARFTGAEVGFTGAELADGEAYFGTAEFAGGAVGFFQARFTGADVSFFQARFTEAEVDFTGAEFVGGEVIFLDASGDCPDTLRAAIDQGEPRGVLLPRSWEPGRTEAEIGSEDPACGPER